MVKKYSSKKDLWLVVVFWAGIISTLLGMLVSCYTFSYMPGGIFILGLQAFAIVCLVWILYGTFYVLDETTLTIKSGPFSWRIALMDIHDVFPSSSMISSPALSLDRVMIIYGEKNKKIQVSPQLKDEFIVELQSANSKRLQSVNLQ
jgi:hypothetical protein